MTNNTTNGNIGSIYPGIVDYQIDRGTDSRMGIMKVAYLNGVPLVDDEYVESANIGVVFGLTGNVWQYTTTNTGSNAIMNFHAVTFF